MSSLLHPSIPLGLIALTGCADAPLGVQETVALARAEQRWRAQQITTYQFESRRLCFCPREVSEWATVQVTNNTVSAITLLDGSSLPSELWYAHPAVPDRFALIRDVPDYTSVVVLRYNRSTGYPTHIEVRAEASVPDGGLILEARNLIVPP